MLAPPSLLEQGFDGLKVGFNGMLVAHVSPGVAVINTVVLVPRWSPRNYVQSATEKKLMYFYCRQWPGR